MTTNSTGDLDRLSLAELRFALEAETTRSDRLTELWKAEHFRHGQAEVAREQLLNERNHFRDRLAEVHESESWRLGAAVTASVRPVTAKVRSIMQRSDTRQRPESGERANTPSHFPDGPLVSVIVRQTGAPLPAELTCQSMTRWEAFGYGDSGQVRGSSPGSRNFDSDPIESGDAGSGAARDGTAPLVATFDGPFPDDPLLLERALMRLICTPEIEGVSTTIGGTKATIRRRETSGPTALLDDLAPVDRDNRLEIRRAMAAVAWLFPRHPKRPVILMGDDHSTLRTFEEYCTAAGRALAFVSNGQGTYRSLGRYHYLPDTFLPRWAREDFGHSLILRCREPIVVVTGTWSTFGDLIPPYANQIAIVHNVDMAIELPPPAARLRVVSTDPDVTGYLRHRGYKIAGTTMPTPLSWALLLDSTEHAL